MGFRGEKQQVWSLEKNGVRGIIAAPKKGGKSVGAQIVACNSGWATSNGFALPYVG